KIPLNDATAPENFQYRIVVNGTVTWMSFSSANIEKNKYLCYSKEITKEKEFTKILQQNASLQHENFEKARYQIIVESSNMIVMEWDIVNDNFYRSKGFEKYAICYEQPNELFNGKANLSVVHSEDVGLLNKFISDSKDTLVKTITKTLRLKTTNNTYEWCRLLGNFICNEQGKRVRIIATITNIDKEIKAQTEIRKANALLNSISDNIFGGIGIFEIIGATTRATYLNAGYYKMLGYKNKEDFGTHAINTIKDMHPEDIDTVLDSVEKSIQTKKPITFTYRAKQKSGNYIWIKALTTYQEMSQEGNPILLSILIDTTQETQNSRLLTEATNTLNSIMDNLPMGIVIIKLVGNNALILYASEQTYSIVGYSKMYIRNIIDTKLPIQFLKVHDVNGVPIKNYLPQNGIFDFNFEHIKPANGKKVWLNVAGKVVETNKAESIIYGVISDATDSITQQKENMKMQELYKMIIREAHMFVFDYDVEKDVLSYSMQDYEQTNKVKKIASFRNKLAHLTTIHPDDIGAFYNIISEGAKKPISGQQDFRAKFGNKEYRWHKGFYKSIADSTEKVFRIIGSSRDTQNEVDLILNLKNKAKLDPMTLLLNKGAVIEMVNNLILEKNSDTYAALLLDIDNFKSINDAFGHLEGDKVLIEVANVLKNEFYGKDVVGRIGGDEFFVFFNVTNNRTLALKKANSLLEKIRNLNNNKKIARPITVSIGIAYSKDSTRKFEDIFGQSDVALYEAKAKSRDAYFVLE
ncbi:MAG: diguanylate cyclase, partial [Clostridia bacterium]